MEDFLLKNLRGFCDYNHLSTYIERDIIYTVLIHLNFLFHIP